MPRIMLKLMINCVISNAAAAAARTYKKQRFEMTNFYING